jgi:hypothetical protein
MNPRIGDPRSSELALRLRMSAAEVAEPSRTRILETLPQTLFISHTSLDDKFIKNSSREGKVPEHGSIWWICCDLFPDPFYHSLKTGAADDYERIVGLSLLASVRVLVVWSQRALRSDYVRAEVLITIEEGKNLAVYLAPDAPPFPFKAQQVTDPHSLRQILQSWS